MERLRRNKRILIFDLKNKILPVKLGIITKFYQRGQKHLANKGFPLKNNPAILQVRHN